MRCPQCSKQFSDSDGAVTHLTNAHGLSRIEARKQVIGGSRSTNSSLKNDLPDFVREGDSFDSTRREMLNRFQCKYEELGRMPTPSELDGIGGYNREEYIGEFGSVYGAAVLAGMTEIDPGTYSHDTDGSKQYSEWDLISEIWRIYELTGKASVRTMDYSGKYSSQTYQYRFGSWSEALRRAKIKGPNPSVAASRDSRQKHYASAEWKKLRSQALHRDDQQCQSCGVTEEEHQEQFGVGLNVHHLTDIAEFDEPKDADTLENLETLCVECHGAQHPFSKE